MSVPPAATVKPDGRRIRAAAAWWLVRALRARHPGRLAVLEVGSWAEPYFVLVLCATRHGAWFNPLAMLNVGGSLHLLARADGRSPMPGPPRVLNLVPWKLLCLADPTGCDYGASHREVRARTVTALAVTLGL